MDVHDKLDELTALVEAARSMPMSASCILNRTEVLALLDDIRELLPEEFRHAEMLLQDREAVVDEGRRESERLLEDARREQARLVSTTHVLAAASEEAERIRQAARVEADAMRREVDDYVDGKLANFEVVLDKTLAAVHRGREKLRGRHDLDPFGDPSDETPLPT